MHIQTGGRNYDGDKDDRGYLMNRLTGEKMYTSIPMHLAFIRKRKDAHPVHFVQMVRFVKWWVGLRKASDPDFRMKSFMTEMIAAHLADDGQDFSNYPDSLEAFFAYIVRSQLKERISFTDYYAASALPSPTGAAIEIFDPVNSSNNVCTGYSETHRQAIVEAAADAVDAIAEAKFATTKERAIACWKDVLGPSFRG